MLRCGSAGVPAQEIARLLERTLAAFGDRHHDLPLSTSGGAQAQDGERADHQRGADASDTPPAPR